MSEWKEVTIEDISSKLGDGLHGTPNYSEDGEYHFINGNNLREGRIIIDNNTKRVSEEEYHKYKKDLTDRTLMVSINGTLGNVAYYRNEKIILGKSACYFNVNQDVSKDFIRYTLESRKFKYYIDKFASGTTIQNLSLRSMRDFTFLLPPPLEQLQIAKTLSLLDQKITLLKEQNKTLETLAQTLFKQWFNKSGFKETELTPLSNLIEIKGGYSYKGNEIGKGSSLLLGMGCVSNQHRFLNKGARFYSDNVPESYLVKPEK